MILNKEGQEKIGKIEMNSTAFYENVSLALKLFPSGNMAPFDSVMTF